MRLRFLELRVSPAESPGSYRLFAASSFHGEAETVSAIASSTPPLETLSSLLEQPRALGDLRTLGRALFESLFRDDICMLFENTLGEVLARDDLILRIVLRIEPPELADLPW